MLSQRTTTVSKRPRSNQAVERTGHTTGFFPRQGLVGCGPPLTAGVRLLSQQESTPWRPQGCAGYIFPRTSEGFTSSSHLPCSRQLSALRRSRVPPFPGLACWSQPSTLPPIPGRASMASSRVSTTWLSGGPASYRVPLCRGASPTAHSPGRRAGPPGAGCHLDALHGCDPGRPDATTTIPIVVGVGINMVEEGLVAGLAQPGGTSPGWNCGTSNSWAAASSCSRRRRRCSPA